MARHQRWPAGKDWLPEAFKQLGANTHEIRENTPEENAAQFIRMFVYRKISREAMLAGIATHHEAIPDAAYYLINSSEHTSDEQLREELRPYAGRVWS